MQICSLKFYKFLDSGRRLLPLVAALLVIAPAGHALAAGKKPAAKHATVAAKSGSARAAGKPALAKSTASRHSSVASARGKGAARLAAAAKGRGAVHLATRQKHERQRTVLAGKGAAHASSKLERSRAERPAAVAATMPGLRIHSVRFEDAGGTRLSVGRESGVGEFSSRASSDPLDLKSSVALVIDQDTKEVLLAKNDHAVQPIASLTKLMTGLIMSEAHLPLDEMITISEEDIDTEKNSRSRLSVGTTLSRGELLHLALMSSENRAAHALGRTYPGGLRRFVALMNARAIMLGMKDTHYVEPTGLSSSNRSSATDLAILVAAAHQDPLLRQLTTSPSYEVAVGDRLLQYNNTNRLVRSPEWDIGLQKTGFINEAGQCLVMQARIAGRKLIMVFLDSTGKLSRIADAERVRHWVETLHTTGSAAAAGAVSLANAS